MAIAIPTATQLRLGVVDILQQSVDPSAGAGVAAAIGSMFLRSGTGQLWLKTGAGNTAWQQLAQSLAWYSVLDYGAIGDGITDDTAAVQAAMNACATAGGGVVFFPAPKTYLCSQLTLTSQGNVQLVGAGPGSIIKWNFNAAAAAGSLVTVTTSDHIKITGLKFDGSGLTNPAASRDNHLIKFVGEAVDTHISRCIFGGMPASSGDGVHAVGSVGNLISRFWVVENVFDGCSRFSVGIEQGYEYVWVSHNYMTNCETEIGIVSTADVNGNGLCIEGNEMLHTSASVRHALRIEGGATTFITRLIVGQNTIIGGFATTNNVKQAVIADNIQTSGAFASSDPAWRVFGTAQYVTMIGNLIDRDPAASAGPCLSFEKSSTSPIYFRIGNNLLINEVAAAGFIKIVDCTGFSVGSNNLRSSDAGISTMYAIDVQAVTVDTTDALVGPGNLFTAGANSAGAVVRLLANGANIANVSVAGNQGDQCDYGLRAEIGGGGGGFTGVLLHGGNSWNSAVGDLQQVGVTIRPRIGLNAGGFGAQYFTGAGSPEGVVTANIGSIYARTDGGQGTAWYYKESGSGSAGWIGVGGAPIIYGTGDTTTAATAVFLAPGWIATSTATEYQNAVSRSATIRNLYVQVATAGSGAATNTYTVRKNAVDTSLAASILNTSTGQVSDTNTAHAFTVVAGDQVSVKVTKSGGVAGGQLNTTATLEFV